MLAVELKHAVGAQLAHLLARAVAEVFFHLEREAAGRGQAACRRNELARKRYLLELLIADAVADEVEQLLVLDDLLFGCLLFLVGLEAEILGEDVDKALALVHAKLLEHGLVDWVVEIEYLIAARADLLALRQSHCVLYGVGRGVVDGLLALGHCVNVFLERAHRVLGGVEDQQILEKIGEAAVLVADAALDVDAEVFPERFVLRAIVAHHFFKLGLDLLFEVLADDLELAVVLQYLARDVQAQVGRIDDAARELEIVVQQLVAVLHDEHAVAVELDALLRCAGNAVVDILAGYEQQRLVGHNTLGVYAQDRCRIGLIAVCFLVPRDALIVGDLGLGALPDRHHGVDSLGSGDVDGVHDGLAVLVLLAGGLLLLVGDVHDDRPADIVGILLDQRLELPYLEVRAVDLLVGVLFNVHDDVRTGFELVALGDGVAVGARAFPLDALFLAVLLCDDGDLVGNHERGIEADAELTDDGYIVFLRLFGAHVVFEIIRSALCDDAEVLLGLVLAHADAVVGHGDRARILVNGDADAVIGPFKADLVIRQRDVAELVYRVGCVGDDLSEEYLLVGVDRVDHEIKQTLALSFELFFTHVQNLRLPYGCPHLPRANYNSLLYHNISTIQYFLEAL